MYLYKCLCCVYALAEVSVHNLPSLFQRGLAEGVVGWVPLVWVNGPHAHLTLSLYRVSVCPCPGCGSRISKRNVNTIIFQFVCVNTLGLSRTAVGRMCVHGTRLQWKCTHQCRTIICIAICYMVDCSVISNVPYMSRTHSPLIIQNLQPYRSHMYMCVCCVDISAATVRAKKQTRC